MDLAETRAQEGENTKMAIWDGYKQNLCSPQEYYTEIY